MGTHMKTTIEIADPLLAEAKALAARRGTTLRAVLEQGLRAVLAEERGPHEAFRLRDASVDGRGLSAEFRDANWQRILDDSYEGRGG
jgi:hypothetical protein